MKKISIVLVILMVSVLLVACGAPAPIVTEVNTDNQEPVEHDDVQEVQEEAFGPFGENDMIFVHEGVEYPISSSAQPLQIGRASCRERV